MRVTRSSLDRILTAGLIVRVTMDEPWAVRNENIAQKLRWLSDITGLPVSPANSIDDLRRYLLLDNRTFLTVRKSAEGLEDEIVATASMDRFVAVQRGQKPLYGNCVTHYWFGSNELAAQFEAHYKATVAQRNPSEKARFFVELNRDSLQTYSRIGVLSRVKKVSSLQGADQRFVCQSKWIHAHTGLAVIRPDLTDPTIKRYMVMADRVLITVATDSGESVATGFDTLVAAYRRGIAIHSQSVTDFWFGSRDLAAQFEVEFG